MNQTSMRHQHLKSAWFSTTILRDHSIKSVLHVETDLVINQMDPAYNSEAMASLTEMLALYMSENIAIDSIDVTQTRT